MLQLCFFVHYPFLRPSGSYLPSKVHVTGCKKTSNIFLRHQEIVLANSELGNLGHLSPMDLNILILPKEPA